MQRTPAAYIRLASTFARLSFGLIPRTGPPLRQRCTPPAEIVADVVIRSAKTYPDIAHTVDLLAFIASCAFRLLCARKVGACGSRRCGCAVCAHRKPLTSNQRCLMLTAPPSSRRRLPPQMSCFLLCAPSAYCTFDIRMPVGKGHRSRALAPSALRGGFAPYSRIPVISRYTFSVRRTVSQRQCPARPSRAKRPSAGCCCAMARSVRPHPAARPGCFGGPNRKSRGSGASRVRPAAPPTPTAARPCCAGAAAHAHARCQHLLHRFCRQARVRLAVQHPGRVQPGLTAPAGAGCFGRGTAA